MGALLGRSARFGRSGGLQALLHVDGGEAALRVGVWEGESKHLSRILIVQEQAVAALDEAPGAGPGVDDGQDLPRRLSFPFWHRITPKGLCFSAVPSTSELYAYATWGLYDTQIFLSDRVFKSSINTRIAVAHEMAHVAWSDSLTRRQRAAWDALSGWTWGQDENDEWEWTHEVEATFVSDYAATNPYEDFAESVENLVIFGADGVAWYGRGESLRECCPDKLAFIEGQVIPAMAKSREAGR